MKKCPFGPAPLNGGPSRLLFFVLLFALLLSPGLSVASPLERGLDTATVRIVSDTGQVRGRLDVYLAETRRDKYLGLSDARTLKTNRGMLFVYQTEELRRFVMRNMDFPLDILFFDSDGRLRAIYHAEARDEPPARSYSQKAQWVLEVNHNWTSRHNVSPGDQLKKIDYEAE